ncbi:MAG: division/cell wall cluster transcriptional repressor MraZ [Melioribacteraceae bacterium]|nr:division/cell wall cluster transcriptional repressor MraZ [Melioribacteraceae bacterium]MCF8412199.1 division/cell wall cluster transcriptional repressor MraZ [Melioribacteraceae bacterium]MCF8432799.1 division/cell wall cluster transcriptional repressor MraZ [Melioribacteraceae bacterium]
MFIGSYIYSIDQKGRVSIPAKLRKYVKPEANDTFVLTRSSEKCIDIYPYDFWRVLVDEKLAKLNMFDPEQAMFVRMFLQEATEDKMDSQYRLSIPKKLIDHANVEGEVFILGALNKIEIWNPQVYEDYTKKQGKPFEEVAKEVMNRRV